ncbi:MAG: long-chain fatty acid--CoA ligase [Pseudomonadota bacterium]|nr:long-chain fatty acid--CoA ligase [Pseudomonadota bacterium]
MMVDGVHVLDLAEWFARRATRDPRKSALTCDGVTWTYAELQDRIERMSAVLAAGGIRAGDRVGHLGFDDPRFFVILFAAARLGAIVVPFNFRLSAEELAFCIEDSGTHTIIVGEDHIEIIDSIRERLHCARFIHRHDGAPGWESASALIAAADAGEAPAAVRSAADDVALIMYTSGTTGRPKGAMLTHGNFWTDNLNETITFGLRADDVTLNFAPLYHVGGLLCTTLATLMLGGHLILHRKFDPGDVIREIARSRVTVTFGVPSMLLFISQHPDFEKADLSSLRLVSVGGAPLPEPLLRLYLDRGIPATAGYGLTETAAMTTAMPADRLLQKLGSSGSEPLLTRVRLIDGEEKEILAPGESGEICVRGGNVTKGYWNRPEDTRSAFTRDGWFRTGDIGYLDEEGFLYVQDRLKDMIISGGENIYPAEVESVLYEHPDIAEVAVIGAPDERWGERVVAVVAAKAGRSVTLESLRSHAERKLARYKLPSEIRLVEALPRNPTGKVLKQNLRDG